MLNSFITDVNGNIIYRIANNRNFDYEILFEWEGINSQARSEAAPGTYILYTEILRSNGQIYKYKDLIVIAP